MKALLNELIVRAMSMPAVPVPTTEPGLPVLSRLSNAKLGAVAATTNADLADVQLQDDLDKLRRSGFVR